MGLKVAIRVSLHGPRGGSLGYSLHVPHEHTTNSHTTHLNGHLYLQQQSFRKDLTYFRMLFNETGNPQLIKVFSLSYRGDLEKVDYRKVFRQDSNLSYF